MSTGITHEFFLTDYFYVFVFIFFNTLNFDSCNKFFVIQILINERDKHPTTNISSIKDFYLINLIVFYDKSKIVDY